ncbi:hypothetical protein NUU61_006834 [Penicillium alfredii]|uniref:Uncharacterized protein n=1 Tax=Penicillium alfredii TaxID=1506179 RepID=A0A9W9K3Q6_9EURO|nr:uncharacterized protein NUU61_006834 [Penicillium alfredii]KAJ5091964.1 hypothetical protein NUU61_006834 [Penicillium alfredii]
MMRFVITAAAVIIGSSVCLYILHQRLSSRVQHRSHYGTLGRPSSKPREIESIPESTFTDQYYGLYDHVSKTVPRSLLPQSESPESLVTKLVRRNMTTFTRLPQALMLRVVSSTPEERRSFQASQIATLDFQEGDLVCDVYRVKVRRQNKVEFEIAMKTMDFVQGRLAISAHEQNGAVVFNSETMMWRRADETRTMPLEMPVVRWMHQAAAWWLVDSGVRYLMELAS